MLDTPPLKRSRVFLVAMAMVGVLCISMSPIFIRFADVPAAYAAFFRAIYALPILATQIMVQYLIRYRGNKKKRTASVVEIGALWYPSGRVVAIAICSGMLLAGDLSFWHRSIGLIGAGLATLIGNSQVIFVSLFAAVFLGEKVPLRIIPLLGLIFFGGWLALGMPAVRGSASHVSMAWLGFFFSIVAAIFYSVFLLSMRRIRVGIDIMSASMLFWLSVGTAGGASIAMLFDQPHQSIGFGRPHLWLLCVAIFAQVLGWQILSYALPRLRTYIASTLLVTQPVLSMTWGWLLCGETLVGTQLLGFIVVLVAISLMMIPKDAAPAST